jgi:acetyl esterase/lipase
MQTRLLFNRQYLLLCPLAVALVVGPGLGPQAQANPPPTEKFEVQQSKSIAYCQGPGAHPTRHCLDVFRPKGVTNGPVVFLVPGGAWMVGNKELYANVAGCLAEQGVVVVLANYRLWPTARPSEQIKDVARAFAWTCNHVKDYGGDPKQIFLCGHSAGGHLVSLLTTDETYLKAEGLNAGAIKGVISVSGVYRIGAFPIGLTFDGPLGSLRLETMWNPFSLVFGNEAVQKKTSPLTHVRPGLPPFLILYAQYELPPLPRMAEDFTAALKAKQCNARIMRITGRNHDSVMFWATASDDPVIRTILEFVQKHKS